MSTNTTISYIKSHFLLFMFNKWAFKILLLGYNKSQYQNDKVKNSLYLCIDNAIDNVNGKNCLIGNPE